MSAQWTLVSQLAQVLARHLQAYMDTAAADAALFANDLRRRLLAALVALAGAVLGVTLGVAWIIGIVWNTPWRNPVLGTMLGAFVLCAVVGAVLAARSHKPGTESFANLRRELSIDQSVLNELCAQERLRQNRGEMRHLFTQAVAADTGGAFLKGVVVRLLLNMTGLGRLLGR